jgi:hypothetical protein
MSRPAPRRPLLPLVLLAVALAGCAGGVQQPPPPSTPAAPVTAAPLPPEVARSVLGEHLAGWWVWIEMPWDDPFLPRCDELAGPEEPCARARTLAGSAVAGRLAVMGPYELDEPSLELLAQGLSQLVVVLPDEATAEALVQALREVLLGWGATARDLPLGDAAWTADHLDTAPGGFAATDTGVVTRMVAVRHGASVVVLSHAERPEAPRLDTEPIARDIARRLAEAR